MHILPGSRLGSYDILAPLGAGGMGEVYRAHDPRLDRDVAIKVLPADLAGNPNRLARFEREAKTLAGLSHPNIVTLFALEEAGGVRFLAMELVDGLSLDRMVLPGGVPLPRLLDIAIPLANGLVAAHGRGVIHRDLKPANVMVTRDGLVKVLDFGLAKLVGGDDVVDTAQDATQLVTQPLAPDAPLSAAGQVIGTAQYMAPEQLRGEAVDARTDLFAFGIVLYELATGKRPFAGTSSAELTSAILRDAPQPSRVLRSDLPDDFHRIVGRCLEKDPDRRFQSATDVSLELRALKRAMQSGTLKAASTEPAERETPSIAVLPFVNMSRDEEHEYFSDGVSEELLNVLAKIRGLRVAARTSAWSFKGKGATIAEMGAALGVATLLEGSVRTAGNRVRIAVQLVQVRDGYHLWSETYDRTLDDIFAVQDDIAQAVVKELRTALLGESVDSQGSGDARVAVAAAAKGRADNPEAHRLLLQARYYIDRFTREDTERGLVFLQQALDLDPEYAQGWALRGRANQRQAGYGWVPLADGVAATREAAERAVALDPASVDGHIIMGLVESCYEWNWLAATASLQRAMELGTRDGTSLSELARLAMYVGRLDAALAICRDAVEQDPLSAAAHAAHGYFALLAGHLEEAEPALRRALEIAPRRWLTRTHLGLVLLAAGRVDEARVEFENEPEIAEHLRGRAVVYHALGREAESAACVRELVDTLADEVAYQIAQTYAQCEQPDAAFEWLGRAVEQRDPGVAVAPVDFVMRSLHGDPRWPAFLHSIGKVA